MDDEDYARELFEILTRPLDPDEPVDNYGTGSDGIDRYDGFGTEVRVTSIDVVPGPYGAQIEVGFLLDLPPELADVPSSGSLLLPLDAEWRQVSGLDEPEDYAPRIASSLMAEVRRHVSAYRPGPGAGRGYEPPDREEQHAMLLHVLSRSGDVEEQAPGRYLVRDEDGNELEVILTPDQWEQVLRKHGAPRDQRFDHYEELLASTPPEERFLVFWSGDLAASTREKLPPAKVPLPPLRDVRQRIAEAEASGKDYGWFAYTPIKDD